MTLLTGMAQVLNQLEAWHWLALGVLLLAIEIVSTTNYLLWPGIAALAVGAVNFVAPALGGPVSLFLFAVLAMASSVIWHRSPYGRRAEKPNNLNARGQTYLGRQGAAAKDFVGGHGAILLDDTRWPAAVSDGSAPRAGDMLQVTGADGTVLRVRIMA